MTLLMIASFFINLTNGQINIAPDASATLDGYINAFNAADDSYAFGFAYPANEALTVQNTENNTIKVYPNFAIWSAERTNPAWFDNPASGPGESPSNPNKKVEASSYVTVLKGSSPDYFDQDVIFSGTVNSYDLTSPDYRVTAFIKVFPADYSNPRIYEQIITSASATFSVTAPNAEFVGSDAVVQYGFSVYGLIADPALKDTSGFSGVEFGSPTLSIKAFQKKLTLKTYPNPTQEDWIIKSSNSMQSIRLLDALGKTISSFSPNSLGANIKGSNLKKGIYFVHVTTTSGTEIIKLIKQ